MNIAAPKFDRGIRFLLVAVLLSGNLLAGGCAGDENSAAANRDPRTVVFVPSNGSSNHWTQPNEGVSDSQGAANAAGSAALSGLLYTASLFGRQDQTQAPTDEDFRQAR